MHYKPFGGRLLPILARGTYSAPPDSLAGLKMCGLKKGKKVENKTAMERKKK